MSAKGQCSFEPIDDKLLAGQVHALGLESNDLISYFHTNDINVSYGIKTILEKKNRVI